MNNIKERTLIQRLDIKVTFEENQSYEKHQRKNSYTKIGHKKLPLRKINVMNNIKEKSLMQRLDIKVTLEENQSYE